jgi:type VI secretion system FHA domain protein
MILTLEVIGEQAEDLGAGSRKVFNAIGGTIGRLPDNDWVFPDPYVSGRHALIRYLNGKYFIEDTSTNGVFINSPDNRLPRTQPQQLRNGDLLYIDAYQIRVSIENDPAESPRNDPFARLKGTRAAPAAEDDRTASLAARAAQSADDDVDDGATQWFGMSEVSQAKAQSPAPAPAPARARARPEPHRPEPHRPEPQQPAPRAPAPAARRSPPAVSRPTVAAARERGAPADAAADLQALLTAAGIDGLDPSSETAQILGEVLRAAVEGVMDALRARDRMKDELRMRSTAFKVAHNNPLKFSANVDDAFHNLLVKHNPAYLGPVDAVEDAFHDVRDHQSAFLAALRIAFETMLAQFDPGRLQEEFDRQNKGSILGVPAKMRYWDMYRDKYGALAQDAEGAFRQLFGDDFANAYEEHLDRLRAKSRGRDK